MIYNFAALQLNISLTHGANEYIKWNTIQKLAIHKIIENQK